jgi:hypothetical protein
VLEPQAAAPSTSAAAPTARLTRRRGGRSAFPRRRLSSSGFP